MGHMEIPGPGIEGSNLSQSSDLCHSCDDGGSLTHYSGARDGTEHSLPQRQCQILNPLRHSGRFASFLLLFSFLFFWLHMGHMEVPGLGMEGTKLSQSRDLRHSCNDVGSLTHCARPGMELNTHCCRDNARSLTCCAAVGTLISQVCFLV